MEIALIARVVGTKWVTKDGRAQKQILLEPIAYGETRKLSPEVVEESPALQQGQSEKTTGE